jgi:flagellar motor protein MotB
MLPPASSTSRFVFGLRLLVALGLLAVLSSHLQAQVNDPKAYKANKKIEKKLISTAEKNIKYEEYRQALQPLNEAYKLFPDNIKTNYLLGISYFMTGFEQQALPHLAFVHKQAPDYTPDLVKYYSHTLHYNLKFDEAIKQYRVRQQAFKPTQAEFMDLERHIAQCELGKVMITKPVEVKIQSLGDYINTPYREFGPIVNADETVMIFTSRNPKNIGPVAQDGMHFEDIWVAYKVDGEWLPPQNMGPLINSTGHDAGVALSADGQTLFLYRDGNGGDLFMSRLEGEDWTQPKPLDKRINTKYWEPSCWLSADEKYLFYVSDKTGGFGGTDIYVSVRDKKGRWTEGINLGPTINTPFDEDAPYLHPDGRTLYFSSDGHPGMGGSDIFSSSWTASGDPTQWSKPLNAGYPINSAGHDRYFILAASGNRAYIASNREGGLGDMDIYEVLFKKPEADVVVTQVDTAKGFGNLTSGLTFSLPSNPVTLLKGVILDEITKEPLAAEIYVIDNVLNDTISILNSNSATGRYLVTLPAGKNYAILVQAEGYLFHSENFDIPSFSEYTEIVKPIELKPVNVGKRVVLRNIFFDFDKATLRPESEAELTTLLDLLKQNPNMRIRIIGHTDSKGDDDYNQKLSEDRAHSVVDYLIAKGIAANRLEYLGKGESEPIDTNDTDAGRQNNRRTEFEVL